MTRTTRDVAQEKLRACEGEITKLRRAKIRDKVEIGKLQTVSYKLNSKPLLENLQTLLKV